MEGVESRNRAVVFLVKRGSLPVAGIRHNGVLLPFSLLILMALMLGATGSVPVFYDITNSTQSYTLVTMQGLSTSDFSNTQYARILVPPNAYLVYINVSDISCFQEHDGRQIPVTEYILLSVKRSMPCPYSYVAGSYSNFKLACGADQTNDLPDISSQYSIPLLGQTERSFVIAVDQHSASGSAYFLRYSNGVANYTIRSGTGVALVPNSELWLSFGFDADFAPQDCPSCGFVYNCTLNASSVVYECPVGMAPITNNQSLTNPVCVAMTNTSVEADQVQSNTFIAPSTTRAVIQLDTIPYNATYVMINVTVPAGAGAPNVSAGSYFVAAQAFFWNPTPSSLPAAHDCGISGQDYDVSSGSYTYITICYAPKWNTSFYIAADVSMLNYLGLWSWTVSTQVVTCLHGLMGMTCADPFTQINPSSQTSVSFASVTGYAYFYFDVASGVWDSGVWGFSATSNLAGSTTIMLRPNAYSAVAGTGGIVMNITSSTTTVFHNTNLLDSYSYSSVNPYSTYSGLTSTPFERYTTLGNSTRWVVTVACPNAGGAAISCTGTLSINSGLPVGPYPISGPWTIPPSTFEEYPPANLPPTAVNSLSPVSTPPAIATTSYVPPDYVDVTSSSVHLKLKTFTGLDGSMDPTNMTLAKVTVPPNAALVRFNVTNVSCNRSLNYDPIGSTHSWSLDLQVWLSRTMPLSLGYRMGLPSTSYPVYFPVGPDNTDRSFYWNQLQFDSAHFEEISMVVSVDRYNGSGPGADIFAENAYPAYSSGTKMALSPGSDLWLGVGFYQNLTTSSSCMCGDSWEFACEMDILASFSQCPPGTLPLTNGGGLDNVTCVTQTNVTVVSDTWQTVNYDFKVPSSVVKLDRIPMNASYVMINITVISGGAELPVASAGSYLASPYARDHASTSAYDCFLDDSNGYVQSSTSSFIMVCFAPKWNSSYYISVDPAAAAGAWSVSTFVATCAYNKTGVACADNLVPLNVLASNSPSTQTLSFAADSGLQHYYFDVSQKTWNPAVLQFSATLSSGTGAAATTSYLSLRPSAYSTTENAFGLQMTDPTLRTVFTFNNTYNYVESENFVTSLPNSILSTPFERYSTSGGTTRWVLTIACPNAGNPPANPSCTGNLTISVISSYVSFPNSVPFTSAPVQVPTTPLMGPTAPPASPTPPPSPAYVSPTPPVYLNLSNIPQSITLHSPANPVPPVDASDTHYGRVFVPSNAYMIVLNVSNTGCTNVSQSGVVMSTDSRFQVLVSRRLPCSSPFATGLGSQSWFVCNPSSRLGLVIANDKVINSWETSFGNVSGVRTFSLIVTLDRHDFITGTQDAFYSDAPLTNPTRGNSVAVVPNSELWLAIGFNKTNTSVASTCTFDLSSTVYSCPPGQYPMSSNFVIGSPICSAPLNVTVIPDTEQMTTPNTFYTTALVVLDRIPANAAYVLVNISIPYSSNPAPVVSGGAYFVAPSAHLAGSSDEASDCGLDPASVTDDGVYFYYQFFCVAPRWNQSYYIAIDVSNATFGISGTWSIYTLVKTCPYGLTGPLCADPLHPIDVLSPTALPLVRLSFTTGPAGFAHYYFDVPANSWNASLVQFTVGALNVSGAPTIALRPDTYTTTSIIGKYLSVLDPQNNAENFYDSWYDLVVSAPYSVISSPFERYRTTSNTRWVVSISCPSAAINLPSGCYGELNITYPHNTIDFPGAPTTPITPAPPQFSFTPAATDTCPPPPPTTDFVCTTQGWLLENVTIDLPSGTLTIQSPAFVVGNLTISTVTITGLNGNLTIINGCANISQQVVLSLTDTDITQLQSSGAGSGHVLIQQSSSCSTPISGLPVSVSGPSASCYAITSQNEDTNPDILSVTFQLTSVCHSSNVWIIAVAVSGAVLLIIIVLVLLAMFNAKFRRLVRPFSGKGRKGVDEVSSSDTIHRNKIYEPSAHKGHNSTYEPKSD